MIVARKAEQIQEDSDTCPATVALFSMESRKVALHITQEDLMRNFNIHMIGKFSLDLLIDAERNVYPIDELEIDIMHHYCVHYAQDIMRVLNVELSSELLANFVVQNMLRDVHVVEYAKNEGGEEEYEQYVLDTVLAQLSIM